MSSDLEAAATDDKTSPKKAPEAILGDEIREGRDVLGRRGLQLFLSGLSAGLDVGFSLFLMGVVQSELNGSLPRVVEQMLSAAMYAVGFIFVVVGRSELFTEQTTLAVLPVLSRKSSLHDLARAWAIVLIANLLGAAGFAGLAVLIGPALGVIEPRVFGQIATSLTAHAAETIFLSAILAGWLMGLLSWLVAAARDTISQVVLTGLVAAVIGFSHLHHVIAGSVEVLAGVFADQNVTARDYGRFLLWSALGNAVGGPLFVALIKYGHANREQPFGH